MKNKLPFALKLLLAGLLFHLFATYWEVFHITRGSPSAYALHFRVLALCPVFFIALFKTGVGRVFNVGARVSPKLFSLWLLVLMSGILIGVVEFSHIRYFSSDLFRFLMPWGYFWVGLTVLYSTDEHNGRLGERIIDIIALLSLIDALATISISTVNWGYRVSTWLHIYGIGWALFRGGRVSLFRRVFLLLLCLVAAVLCGKRGNLLAIPLATVATFSWSLIWLKADRSKSMLRLVMVSIIALLVWLAFTIADDGAGARIKLEDRYYSTLRTMDVGGGGKVISLDASYDVRIDETRNVLRYLNENPYFIPIGAGFGATAPIYYNYGIMSPLMREMHHVHIGWTAYLLRNGVFGILLLVSFYIGVFRRIVQRRLEEDRNDSAVAVMVYGFSLYLIMSLKSTIMLEWVELPLISIAAWANCATYER